MLKAILLCRLDRTVLVRHPRFPGKPAAAVSVAAALLALVGTQTKVAAIITPAQMSQAYSLTGVTFGSGAVAANGAGQTIAIIDPYDDPYILTATDKFNTANGLQSFNTVGGPTLTVVGQTGTSMLPSTTTTSIETALDVQWAHVMAPQANILLVEANSLNSPDLDRAVNVAKAVPGVSVVSMSYGSDDKGFNYTSRESTFTQAVGHAGVSFVASSGDATTPLYPATSQHVFAIGGTTLIVDSSMNRSSETVWTQSGTGYSAFNARPTFQDGVNSNAKRGIPDLVMDGDPDSGVRIYSGNTGQYVGVGGTSLSAPLFAGLLADANQGRSVNGLPSLTSDDALNMIYKLVGTPLYSSCFYDVTSVTGGGSVNGFSAGIGYDVPSGLGAPIASGLLQYLAGYTTVPEPTVTGLLLLAGSGLRRHRKRR